MANKSLISRVEQALSIIAGSRFINSKKRIIDITPLDIENESSRLERLFEKWWTEKDNETEYYTSLAKWIKDNQTDLINPQKFVGDISMNPKYTIESYLNS